MGKWTANITTYLDVVRGYFRYKDKIKHSSQWLKKTAEVKNLALNPHKPYLTFLQIWLAENEEIYGKKICPCFEATGEDKADRMLMCPCSFSAKDIEEHGTCHCNLFGKKELTAEDWKKQEHRIRDKYLIPFKKLDEQTIDTRNVSLDTNRRLEVPSPVHQFKQAYNQLRGTFQVIVEREQSAKNILHYCNTRNLKAEYHPENDYFLVTINKYKKNRK